MKNSAEKLLLISLFITKVIFACYTTFISKNHYQRFRSYCHDLGVFFVTYKTGFGLDDCIYFTLNIHTTRNYRQYNTIAELHTLQFNVARALGFSIFTSLILATDL
jgi:uncharacterized membrane protein